MEKQQIDLNLLYQIDKDAYLRITDFMECNQIKNMSYHEEGDYAFIFLKTVMNTVEIISLYKGDGILNEPRCDYTIVFPDKFKDLKKIISSKDNHYPTEFTLLAERIDGFTEYQRHYIIKNKKYFLRYTWKGETKEDYQDFEILICGDEVNQKIKELREQGYVGFSIFDDRSYLECSKKKEQIPFVEIFNQINDMNKKQVKEIMDQCMRVLTKETI
jgi:hypothetical protein